MVIEQLLHFKTYMSQIKKMACFNEHGLIFGNFIEFTTLIFRYDKNPTKNLHSMMTASIEANLNIKDGYTHKYSCVARYSILFRII